MKSNIRKASMDSFLPIAIIVVISFLLLVPLIFLFGGSSKSGTGGTSEAVAADVTVPEDKRMMDILDVYSSVKAGKNYATMGGELNDLGSKIDAYNDSIQKDATIPDDTKAKIQTKVEQIEKIIYDLVQKISAPGYADTAESAAETQKINNNLKNLETYILDLKKLVRISGSALGVAMAALAKQIATQNESDHAIKYVRGGSNEKGMDCSGFISYIFQKKSGLTIRMTTQSILNGQLNKYFDFVLGDGKNAVSKADLLSFASSGLQVGDLIVTNGAIGGHVVIYVGPTIDSEGSFAHSTTLKEMSGPQLGNMSKRLNRDDLATLAIVRWK